MPLAPAAFSAAASPPHAGWYNASRPARARSDRPTISWMRSIAAPNLRISASATAGRPCISTRRQMRAASRRSNGGKAAKAAVSSRSGRPLMAFVQHEHDAPALRERRAGPASAAEVRCRRNRRRPPSRRAETGRSRCRTVVRGQARRHRRADRRAGRAAVAPRRQRQAQAGSRNPARHVEGSRR